jgi:tetratricopeptide (TPR) repeat protein
MGKHSPTTVVSASALAQKRVVLDVRGRPYEPAVGPRLKIVLFFIFAGVALLGATGLYLVAIRLLNWARQPQTYTNVFTLWMFIVHILAGIVLIIPFLFFGFAHLASARHRKNRLAVRLGIAVFTSGIIVGITGLALIQLNEQIFGWRIPQLPTDSMGRIITYYLHALVPLAAVGLYVLHRRAGPEIQWKWGIAWTGTVVVLTVFVVLMHYQDPRKWYAKGSPEGERYFEPSKARTVDGTFIPAQALMMDDYCKKCHADIYDGWFHSAHRNASFNNRNYLFSVRETRKVSLQRDGELRASRWCAGCHDPVPFLSGQFDDPKFDDVNHPTSQAGITCTVCHAMVNVNSRIGNGDYTIEEPEHYPFAYSDNPILQWLNNQTVKAKPDFHKRTFLKDFHKSEKFCSTCHKVSLPMEVNHYKEFLRGQNHSDTFLLSGVSGISARSFYYPSEAKENCQACHMPLKSSSDFGSKDFDGSGTRKIHDHFFPGANTAVPWQHSQDAAKAAHAEGFRKAVQMNADFLRGTDPEGKDRKVRIDIFGLKEGGEIKGALMAPLRPQLPALKPGQSYLVEVVIRTLLLGHPFTQGTADSNEVWVEFTARSGDRIIGRSGDMDGGPDAGRVDEWAHFVNILMLDFKGGRIDRRNPQDIFTPLYNHQIPPGAAQVVHYKFEVPAGAKAPVELAVRLRFRKFDYKYMEYVYDKAKVPALPVVDLCEDRLTLPVEGVAAHVPEQLSPIQPAWQRWNDYGIGCLLEGGPDAKKGELRQAEEAFKQLLAGSAKDAYGHAHLNLARVYNAEGRLSEAVQALNQARTADPPAPWWTVAWFAGLVNAQNGHLDEAIGDLQQILDPAQQPRARKFDFTRDYVVINELGKTLFERSQQEHDDPAKRAEFLRRAVEQLEKTLAIDPEDLEAHYWLAQCFARLGREQAGLEKTGGPVAAEDKLPSLAKILADDTVHRSRQLLAAGQIAMSLAALAKRPAEPRRPKLPLLQGLVGQCLPVYRQQSDQELASAAALILGHLHRQQHAIFKPDDNAQDQVMGIYRKAHPAAANASFPIVIYPLH